MPKIVTLTFFKFKSLRKKAWAFGMMQFAHKDLQSVQGQTFYKLMGSGKGKGFNPLPDWSTYCLLQVWENNSYAIDFFESSLLIKKYQNQTARMSMVFMQPIMSRGSWSRVNPFENNEKLDLSNSLLAVITRATIRPSKLWRFWSYVPKSQEHIDQFSGLLFTKGVGEVPLLQMATFSIWKSKEELHKFAYENKNHKKAIELTKELDWYSEELFARFKVLRIEGDSLW